MSDETEKKVIETTKLKVVNFIDSARLVEDISYSTADLSGAQQEQASLFVHYGTLAAKAARQLDDMEMALEALEAVVYRKNRDAFVEAGTKFTEELLKQAVISSPQIRQMKRLVNEAKQIEAVAKTAQRGFEHRRDMLIQQGATERQERQGELRTMSVIATAAGREAVLEDQKGRVLDRLKTINKE